MKFFSFVECFILTCLGSYPFYAIVNYKLDPMEDFRSCNEPCFFIRKFGTDALPATTPANLKLDCSKYEDWFLSCSDHMAFPIFVAVENGRNFSVASFHFVWKNYMGKAVQILSGSFGMWQKASDWPSPANVHQTDCETESVREKIDNHLNTGYTIPIYKVGIAGWTFMKVLHDWGLLADVPEKITLWLGICSWSFQLVATWAAFSWGASAAEVFIARETNGACFYQLKPIQTFTALGTPLLLLSLTHFKLKNLMLSVVKGDFLYYKSYDVPYRVVKATAAEDPLLTTGLRGDPGFPAAPYQQLTFREMYRMSMFTEGLHFVYTFTVILLICPFGFGNLFLRMAEVAASHDFSWDPNGLIKLATLAVAGALLLMFPLMLLLLLFLKEAPKWTIALGRLNLFALLASISLGAWPVFQAVWQKGTYQVEQRYEWYLCGISAGYIGLGILFGRHIIPATEVLSSYNFAEEVEQKFARIAQELLVRFGYGTQSNEENIPSELEMLLAGSDRYTSHAEQVLEVFSSQPEKVKHLRPHDTKESHAQLETSDDDSSSGTDGVTACWKVKHDSP